jgi:hypothetical protein
MNKSKITLSKEELLDKLRVFYNENGRTPKKEDVGENKQLPSQKVCIRICGVKNWNDVLNMANLPITFPSEFVNSCSDILTHSFNSSSVYDFI